MRTSTLPPTPTPPSTLSSLLRASLFRGEGKREVRGESSESEDVVSPFMYGMEQARVNNASFPFRCCTPDRVCLQGQGFGTVDPKI